MAVRHDIEMTPRFPTAVKKRYPDGRCVSTPRSPGDRGTWLYRAVPLGAVTEATTPDGSLLAGQPLMEVMDGLATLASEKVRTQLGDAEPRKVIVRPPKLVNIVP